MIQNVEKRVAVDTGGFAVVDWNEHAECMRLYHAAMRCTARSLCLRHPMCAKACNRPRGVTDATLVTLSNVGTMMPCAAHDRDWKIAKDRAISRRSLGRHAHTCRIGPRELKHEAKSLKDMKTQQARPIAAYYSIR